MESRILSPVRATILIGVVSLCVFLSVACARSVGVLQRLELAHYDWMVAKSATSNLARNVVIVAIEEQDIKSWGWPLSDQKLADILEVLTTAGVSAIGVDIYRETSVAPGRSALEQAFSGSNTIWITKLDASGENSIPAPAFAEKSGRVGFADVPVDSDGVARRALLLVHRESGLALSLGTQLAMLASNQSGLKAWPQDPRVLMFGQTPVPRLIEGFGSYLELDDSGYQILLEYPNKLPVAAIIPARELLSYGTNMESLSGKVAIVGITSPSIKDNFRTPLNNPPENAFAYGVQVHAAMVQQMIDYSAGRTKVLRSPVSVIQLGMLSIASIGGAALGYMARTVFLAAFLGPGLSLGIGLALSAFFYRHFWLPALPVSLAWFLAFLITFMFIGSIVRKQRKVIATLFSNHLSPELSAEIWKERDVILSGGKPVSMRLYTSILFADLAGSTTIGAAADPKEYMDWASNLLNEMSRISRANGGFVEKFTGDGILVVFGAPLARKNKAEISADALTACRSALQFAEAVDQLNSRPGLLAPYRVRIGLHSGSVLGGTLGSSGSLQYNVMGDTVNIAARIEAYGKTLADRQNAATTVCLSGELLAHARDQIECEPAGKLQHDDGKSEFQIYRLKGINRAQ